ncbi:MAG TPA: GerMN domain-containing protein [Terriglobales bacterium]|nr:GerMN domain-containing protein [Terriglobales bacterium]
MSPRWRVWVIAALSAAVLIAAIYFPFLRRRVKKEQKPQPSEERVRQELTEPAEENAGNPSVKTTLFWAADENDSGLAPVTVELPLSNDPAMRARQVLNTLVAGPVDADLRTLPPDAVLLAFYLLPDGTGIADFSEALATSTPSGIQSEQLAVDSIARTLEANVPQVKRLKILIHGQEMETLAGHVDLTETFVVDTKAGASPSTAAPSAKPAAMTSANPPNQGATTAPPHK